MSSPAEASTAARSPGRRRRRITSRTLAPYLFVLPNMLIFSLFTIWPAINMFNISLYDSNNGRTFRWVGTQNFTEIVSSTEFVSVFIRTLIFTALYVTLTTLLATLGAVLLNDAFPGRGFFRAVAFLPSLLSAVVVGLLWGWLLERTNGLVNNVLVAAGGPRVAWLTDDNLTFGVIVFVGLWIHVGFYTLIMLSGLQGIEPVLYEAARVDGATGWRQFTQITWPLLQPTTLVVVILSTISGFQSFDFIWSLTGGGPVGATTLMVQYVYEKAFTSPVSYGLASAGTVVLFCCVFAFTLFNYLYGRRQEAA